MIQALNNGVFPGISHSYALNPNFGQSELEDWEEFLKLCRKFEISKKKIVVLLHIFLSISRYLIQIKFISKLGVNPQMDKKNKVFKPSIKVQKV